MTSNFDRVESGPNPTASWLWAKTKPGQGIIRGNIPSTIDHSLPVYAVKYRTVSYLKESGSVVPGTEINHLECGFFYISGSQIICGNGQKDEGEQCDDGNTNNNDACSNLCTLSVC